MQLFSKAIIRKVGEHGLFVRHYKVEVYLTGCAVRTLIPPVVLSHHSCKADTIMTIEKEVGELCSVPAEHMRLGSGINI